MMIASNMLSESLGLQSKGFSKAQALACAFYSSTRHLSEMDRNTVWVILTGLPVSFIGKETVN